MLLLKTGHHASEVLANEVFEEGVGGIALRLVVLLEDLIGEVGTCFESKTLREAKGVVAVEEDVLDL